MPLVARVCSITFYACRAVRRALRILAFCPRIARGTVSSLTCDDHQRSAAEFSQLEQDRRNTQYAIAVRDQAGLTICEAVVVCDESSVITVVAAMSTEQFARDLIGNAPQQWEIQISRRSGMEETQAATVKPGVSVRSAWTVVRTPHCREATIFMTARVYLQSAAKCAI
jgi:hypothetical protein